MSKTAFIELAGRRFGRLVVLRRAPNLAGRTRWECICDCGENKIVVGSGLKRGDSRSCGCFKRELTVKKNTTHGMCYSRENRIWSLMKSRCTNPKSTSYKYYGGRGITFCERWNSFENFFDDMGPLPSQAHSIDRIDNDGNYEPSNCRWATNLEQAKNKRPYPKNPKRRARS